MLLKLKYLENEEGKTIFGINFAAFFHFNYKYIIRMWHGLFTGLQSKSLRGGTRLGAFILAFGLYPNYFRTFSVYPFHSYL